MEVGSRNAEVGMRKWKVGPVVVRWGWTSVFAFGCAATEDVEA